MQTGTIFSGIGHAGLVLWVLAGDWLFPPTPAPELITTSFSVISSDEFAEMQAAAAVPSEENTPEEPAVVEEPVAEEPPPVEEPVVEPPLVEEPPPVEEPPAEVIEPPPPLEVVEEVVPDAPPPSDLPQADTEQVLDSASTEINPTPEAEDIIAPEPVEVEPELAPSDTPTPAVSDEVTEAPVVEETPTEATTPEDTAPTLATEETVVQDEETGMKTSLRPRSRPAAVEPPPEPDPASAEPVVEPVEDPPEETPVEQPVDDQATEDLINDLLGEPSEEPVAETAAESGGQDLPQGPPMLGGEKDEVRSAINRCFAVGSLSTAATRVRLELRVEMSPDGRPVTIELVGFSNGDETAANQAFQYAKRAVMRSVDGCSGGAGLTLDPAKYGEWNVMNLTFDASKVLLR
jgi:hypothetical protein